jgi:CHASE3 domain sensor protein
MHELKGEMKSIREQMAGLREDLQRQVDATKVDRRDTWARGAVVVAAVCFTVGTTVNLLIAVLS